MDKSIDEMLNEALNPEEVRDFKKGLEEAIKRKKQNGFMTLARFVEIMKDACGYIWGKISGLLSNIWDSLVDFFS